MEGPVVPKIPVVGTAGAVRPSDQFFLPPRVNSAQEFRASLRLHARSVNAAMRKTLVNFSFFQATRQAATVRRNAKEYGNSVG
jgi:hypothetical protein